MIFLLKVTISYILLTTSSKIRSLLEVIVSLIRFAYFANNTYIKGMDTKDACIIGIYTRRTYTKDALTSSIYIKNIYIRVAFDIGTCVKSVCIIECLEMHLQSF